MDFKMRTTKTQLNLIKNNKYNKDYRIYDEKRKKIKVGDYLILATNDDYVRVRVEEIIIFESYKELKKINPIKLLEEYYGNKFLNNKIIQFKIKVAYNQLENKKVLIDPNIAYHMICSKDRSYQLNKLYQWFKKLNIEKKLDNRIYDEISLVMKNNKQIKEYNPFKYNNGKDNIFIKQTKFMKNNYKFQMLLQVYNNSVDYLLTNDLSLIKYSKKLFISDRVFHPEVFLKNIEDKYPDFIDYDVLSVKLVKFQELNIYDDFFNSLREDYEGFDYWFEKKTKNKDSAYILKKDNKILGMLYLKLEFENENYDDFKPKFKPKKRLKIGTFKIDKSGFKLGERFIKIVIDNAVKQNVDEVYVTMFENKRNEVDYLKEFLKKWGFDKYGKKISTGEIILVKSMREYKYGENPKYNYPLIKENPNYYFLPIDNKYHTDLFPDLILNNENLNLYTDYYSHRYAIEKIYISSASIPAKPGDIVLIYRSGERTPKKYSSVVTGVAIVKEVIIPKTINEYLKECSDRSVFTDKELKKFYLKNKWRKVIKLLYYKSFDKKIILNELYKLKAVENGKGPRPFLKINSKIYGKIIKKASGINE